MPRMPSPVLITRTDGLARRKTRVLFFAEAVTLAHVARPLTLAQTLDPERYEVCFACDDRYDKLMGKLAFARRSIRSLPGSEFLSRLAKGSCLYSAGELRDYVEEDLAVMKEFEPDLVVGDFRLSLSISARILDVPYVTITNAYWSPNAKRRFPLPEIPLIRLLGENLGEFVFQAARPIAFALHCLPMWLARRTYRKKHPNRAKLRSLGFNLCRVYTDADYTLYADVPELSTIPELPAHQDYLGAVLWSPAVKPPQWWDELPQHRPIVYVTLGSSGETKVLEVVLQALAELSVTVLAATAGRVKPENVPANAFVADYLPGVEAAGRARLVICNGGSPTTQQALSAGVPVLAICSNMDQFMNMDAIQKAGAGELLRAGNASAAAIRTLTSRLLNQSSHTEVANRMGELFASWPMSFRFQEFVEKALVKRSARVH